MRKLTLLLLLITCTADARGQVRATSEASSSTLEALPDKDEVTVDVPGIAQSVELRGLV